MDDDFNILKFLIETGVIQIWSGPNIGEIYVYLQAVLHGVHNNMRICRILSTLENVQ